jgi:hypothetical protein
MEVNITLVLQALQFFCAYYFLYKFLFIPACKILDEQKHLKKMLYKKLEEDQQVKDALLQDYYVKNNVFKSMLIETIPLEATQIVHQKTMFDSTSYCIEKIELSEQNKKKTELFLIDHLSRVIKK